MHDALRARGPKQSGVWVQHGVGGKRGESWAGCRGPVARAKEIGLHSEGGGKAWRVWGRDGKLALKLAGSFTPHYSAIRGSKQLLAPSWLGSQALSITPERLSNLLAPCPASSLPSQLQRPLNFFFIQGPEPDQTSASAT